MIGTFLCQHDGRGIRVAADNVRHHRSVNHRQSLDTHDPKVFVNDLANAAGAGGMVDRAGLATNVRHGRFIIVEVCLNSR